MIMWAWHWRSPEGVKLLIDCKALVQAMMLRWRAFVTKEVHRALGTTHPGQLHLALSGQLLVLSARASRPLCMSNGLHLRGGGGGNAGPSTCTHRNKSGPWHSSGGWVRTGWRSSAADALNHACQP